ncbi:hypothetical protein MXAN_3246 [Myxococcus xanthus DK 1622]|uniref:Uncharacterized protein n=1 Tax=Myxococcus xanthus (strain DK1622) TaxID=246197 RepID=Q1D7C8_MYXXD|nr:hypothetical protein MXAN_3246 [Myxococcus xanthus DK 1622]
MAPGVTVRTVFLLQEMASRSIPRRNGGAVTPWRLAPRHR